MTLRNLDRNRMLPVVGLFLTIFAVSSGLKSSAQQAVAGNQPSPQQPPPGAPVERVRKNIQVLKGLPDTQLFLLMNFVGDSLGVHCDYCHVKGPKNPQTGEDTWLWEKDDKREKLVGRDMMRMVLELNGTKFNREAVVTCFTCHRGSTRPERSAPLPPRDFVLEGLQKLQTPKRVLPGVQEVVAKYLSAVGADRQDVLAKAIVMRGAVERVERAKASGSIEIIFKQPNKARVKETTPAGTVTRGTNGTTVWAQTSRGVIQLTDENLRTIKETPTTFIFSGGLLGPIKIPDALTRAVVDGISRVGDRDTYLVLIDESTQSTQLFFDVETGLLLRRLNITSTRLGPLSVQWDFSDYRNVNGLKLPFIIRTSNVASYDTVVRRFSEIRIDPTLDDSVFDVPKTASP